MEGSASSTAAVCSMCDRAAVYAFEGDAASLCERHQPIDPVEALTKLCHSRGCVSRVSHGWERDGALESCAAHAQQGMVQMRGVPCEFPCCRSAPIPALQGEAPGRRCKAHLTSPSLAKAADGTGRSGEKEKGQQNGGVVQGTPPWPADGKAAATTPSGSSLSKRRRSGASKAAALAAAAAAAERTDMKVKKQAPAGGGGGSSSRHGATLICESPLCNKNPSFGYRGQSRRRFCKLHAEPGTVNVYYRYCDADGDRCPERASFEADGKLRCLRHREPGMRPRNKICQVEGGGCTRQSSFGVEGGKPVLCTLHKEAGMVQVRTKTCRHLGCDKIPSYGYPCKSREFCKPHALGGMVYSAGSRCRFRGCGLPGVFNYPWIARGGSFCGNHKEDGMVDSTPKRCESAGCNYAASFGNTTQRTRRFCARHKLGGMLSSQELWPRPGDKTTKAKASPTNAEKALAADLAAPTAAAAPTTLSSDQPQKTRNSNADAAEPTKRPRTQKTPSPGGQLATARGPSTFERPESPGLADARQLDLLADASTPVFDGMPPPPPRPVATVLPEAGASAAPASSVLDLDFLADAAASATTASGTLGVHPAGDLSPAAVEGLRGSQPPVIQAPVGRSSQGISGAATTAAAAAAAAAENSNATPLPSSREYLSVGRSILGAAATAGTTAAAAAAAAAAENHNDTPLPPSREHLSVGGTTATTAATAGSTAAGASGGASMPALSAGTASVSLDIDMCGGIGPLDSVGQTEEEAFLASLVNSIDPADPKTFRVRGAMLSRLKSIGRTMVAS